jgi:hypothetical protein
MIGTSTLLPKRLVAMSWARADSVPLTTRTEGEKRSFMRLPTKPRTTTSISHAAIAVLGLLIDAFHHVLPRAMSAS